MENYLKYKSDKIMAEIGFCNEEKNESIWDEYIGRYVLIYSQQGTTFAGKITGIKEGYAVLNPFQGGKYDSKKGLIKVMVNENSKVRLIGCIGIKPITKKI
ncbi:MAG: hypothetical protein ABH804_00755 [archaeon]